MHHDSCSCVCTCDTPLQRHSGRFHLASAPPRPLLPDGPQEIRAMHDSGDLLQLV